MIERRKLFGSVVLVVAAILSVVTVAVTARASAQQAGSGGNALRISPVRTDLTIEPGKSKTVDIVVRNMSARQAALHPVVNDFTVRPDNETGQPNIILDGEAAAPRHSLKQYVNQLQDFTLGPNEEKTIKVTVAIPAGTAGGGYFGAVRFEPADVNSGQQVSLSGSVGSLVLVRVPGDIVEKVSLASFDVRKGNKAGSFFTSKEDLKAVTRFKNEGNVQVQPFGKIILKSQSGKVLATYEVNDTDPRGNVLPDSVRRFETALDKIGSFGKFTLEGNFGYGSNGQLLTAQKTVYLMPLWAIICFSLLIVLVILGIFVLPRLVRAYNANVIKKATRGRKR